jgi:hypothetical protein
VEYIAQARAYRIGRAVGKLSFMPIKVSQKIGQRGVKTATKGVVGGVKLGLGGLKNSMLFTAGMISASPIVEEATDIARAAKGTFPYAQKALAAGQAAGHYVETQVHNRLRPERDNQGNHDGSTSR